MRLFLPAFRLFLKNLRSYLLIFVLLICCTVLINANLSELFAKTRYTDDIRHFAEQDAYILSQAFSLEDGVPSLSDDVLSEIRGIRRVISCSCGRTTLHGLMPDASALRAGDIYAAYVTNGYTDEVKVPLYRGRLPEKRDDDILEILVGKSLSGILELNREYTFTEFDEPYRVLVAGLLEDSGSFLALTGSGNAASYFKEITADPGWIIIPKEHSYVKSYIKILFFEPELTEPEKDELITALNSEYGYVYSFESVYRELSESVKKDIIEKLPLCILLLVICFLSISGCVSLNTVNDLRIYGIFRLHGATKEQCFAIASLMNLTLTVSALVFSVPVFRLYASAVFRQPPYVSWRNYLITLLIYAAVFLVSTVIPRIMLNKTVFHLYNEASF